MATEITLGYSLKLFPTRSKADTLAALADLFKRSHSIAIQQLTDAVSPSRPSLKGLGGFIGRAYWRASIDYRRACKSRHQPGTLKAELIDAAYVQQPRKARGFDCWVMLRGTTSSKRGDSGFYLPAKYHKAINRALALPGAKLNAGAEVYRRNGKWYARVSVTVPQAEIQEPKGWLGCDVGVKAAVTRSDGYRGPDLRPIIQQTTQRKADPQRHGSDRQTTTHQRQILAKEARRAVSVAQRSGRGISLEDPRRLPRWKLWAGRYFAKRVSLLAAIYGVLVALVPPPYTSITCPRCGWVEKQQRHKQTLRCWRCRYTHNADFCASQIIRRRAHGYCHSLKILISPFPGGVNVDN